MAPSMAGMLALGLAVQAAALIILLRRVGSEWLTHIGAVFILLATAYHGLNEVLLWLFPDRDVFRPLVSPAYQSGFVMWISVAILLLTIAYVLVLGRFQSNKDVSQRQVNRIRKVFDWRLMLAALIPLAAITIIGQGGVRGNQGPGIVQPVSVGTGLALQYLLLASAWASFGLVCRFGRRWLIPALVVQSIIAVVVGSRLEIFIAAGLLIYTLARVGISLSRLQVAVSLALVVVVAVVLTSARAAEGRLPATAGSELRFEYLIAGVRNVGSPDTWNLVAYDLGHRLDGNSFGAMELQALDGGSAALGITPLFNDVMLAVPSLVNPSKDYAPLENRSEKNYAELYLGLPLPDVYPGVPIDILPTQLGATIGFWGPGGMLVIAVLLGLAFAAGDRWLLRELTPTRLLLGMGLLSCALFYEGSWDTYSVTFRGIVLLLPVVWFLEVRMTSDEKLVHGVRLIGEYGLPRSQTLAKP